MVFHLDEKDPTVLSCSELSILPNAENQAGRPDKQALNICRHLWPPAIFLIFNTQTMIYRFAVCCCLLIAAGSSAKGQPACTHRLQVQVTETHSGLQVAGAVLYLNNQSYYGDASGSVISDSLCEGAYTWLIEAEGHEPDSGRFVLGNDTLMRIRLAHSAQSLQQVIVRDERLQTILQTKETLSEKQLDENAGKSLGQILASVNGVNVFSNGGTIAKPVIHGLRNNRILTLNNGIRQEDQQWGDEHASGIDPFLAGNITVLKGAAGVRYGADAIGGVILIAPAALRARPGWGGELNLAGFSNNRMGVAEGMIEHAFAKIPGLTVRLQGTVKRGGNYRIPGYWAANTGLSETDYSFAAAYRKAHSSIEVFYSHYGTELGIYRGSHTGSRDDLLNAINSDTPRVSSGFSYTIERPKQHVVHDLVKLKGTADTRLGKLGLTYAYQHNFRQEYDVTRVETGVAQLNLTLNTHTLNLHLDQKATGNFSGQFGVDGIYQNNFFRDGDRLFIPAYSSGGGGAYAIERWKKNALTLEGGLRYDYRHFDVVNFEGANQQAVHYSYQYNSLSATFGATKTISKALELSAIASTAWRAPQANELFSAGLHQGAARVELGNKDLVAERAYGLNLESKWTKNRLSTELSLYSQYIKDYIFLSPGEDLLTIRGYYKSFRYLQTNAWLNGADLSAAFRWNNEFQTAFKASFLLARDVDANDWLILMPPDRISLGNRYTRTLTKHLTDCYIEVNGQYMLRQARVPRNFDSLDYPRPPSGYFLLDAAVGATIMAGAQAFKFSLSVENAGNTRYRQYLDAFRYFIDQPGTNVVLRLRIPINTN